MIVAYISLDYTISVASITRLFSLSTISSFLLFTLNLPSYSSPRSNRLAFLPYLLLRQLLPIRFPKRELFQRTTLTPDIACFWREGFRNQGTEEHNKYKSINSMIEGVEVRLLLEKPREGGGKEMGNVRSSLNIIKR